MDNAFSLYSFFASPRVSVWRSRRKHISYVQYTNALRPEPVGKQESRNRKKMPIIMKSRVEMEDFDWKSILMQFSYYSHTHTHKFRCFSFVARSNGVRLWRKRLICVAFAFALSAYVSKCVLFLILIQFEHVVSILSEKLPVIFLQFTRCDVFLRFPSLSFSSNELIFAMTF